MLGISVFFIVYELSKFLGFHKYFIYILIIYNLLLFVILETYSLPFARSYVSSTRKPAREVVSHSLNQ